MCDCDCELPKQERWRQIREQALHDAGVATVPGTAKALKAVQVWWDRDRYTPRTVCPNCQFETTVGREESHAPGCEGDE